MNVFPEPVFKQTIVLCSRAASRSSTLKEKRKQERQLYEKTDYTDLDFHIINNKMEQK